MEPTVAGDNTEEQRITSTPNGKNDNHLNAGKPSTEHLPDIHNDIKAESTAFLHMMLACMERMVRGQEEIRSGLTSLANYVKHEEGCPEEVQKDVNVEKLVDTYPPEKCNSNERPSSDSVVIVEPNLKQKSKGKAPMEEGINADLLSPKVGTCNKGKYRSEYKRKKTSMGQDGTSEHDLGHFATECSFISKQLFTTPPPTSQAGINRQASTRSPDAVDLGFDTGNPLFVFPTTKSPSSQSLNRITPNKRGKHYTPKGFKSKFKPTPDMGLKKKNEHEVALYVYGTDLELSEVLYKFDEVKMTRKDFFELCPGRIVKEDIIRLTALKTTMSQTLEVLPTTWTLPPSFSDDILFGVSLDDVISKYSQPWMPPTSDLRYIYVPMCDRSTHWYLMVVSLFDKKVYWLDSYKKSSEMHSRHSALKFVQSFIHKILMKSASSTFGQDALPDISIWNLVEAEGIPNCGDSKDSSIWILDWMAMEDSFQPNVFGKLNEQAVRMRTMLNLVMSVFNQVGKRVEARAGNLMRSYTPSTV